MNELKDLVNMLDGFSCDNTGFMILSATKDQDCWYLRAAKDQDCWYLRVQGYHKELEFFSTESSFSVSSLVEKIEGEYSTNAKKWKVLKVEELKNNLYDLTVKYQGDNKNEENSGLQEKQMETEK